MAEKNQIKRDLCYASSGYLLNRNILSTGFNVDSALLQNDTLQELAELYLLNSHIDADNAESVYTISKYLRSPFTEMTALSNNTVFSGLEKIPLADSFKLEMSFDEITKRRKSSRKYTGDFVPPNYLSTLLRATNGVTHQSSDSVYERKQRSCPSGGGLYPVKIYIYANKIRKIKRGIYYYNPLYDALYAIQKNENDLDTFLTSQNINELPNIAEVAFIVFFTIESWRSISKYGSTGLRFSYIELGEMAQQSHLAATCLGLGSCAYASFQHKAVNTLLNIDGDYESFQHAILFGISSEK